jgi:hypothetical protein
MAEPGQPENGKETGCSGCVERNRADCLKLLFSNLWQLGEDAQVW